MKFIKNNIEVIVLMFITFYVFISMFIIYEKKIIKYEAEIRNLQADVTPTFKESNDTYIIRFTAVEKINKDYIKILIGDREEVVTFDEDFIKVLKDNNDYYFIVDKVSKGTYYFYEIQRLLDENNLTEIRGVE